jgi:hypothetical protein
MSEGAAGRFGRQLGAGAEPELGEHMGEVVLHRAPTDEEPFADLGVGEAHGRELDDLEFGGVRLAQPDEGRLRSPRAREA